MREKFGWERKSKSFIDLTTLSTVLGPVGLALGSQLGTTIGTKIGYRNTLIGSNVFGIFSILLKLILTQPTVLLGRFLSGLSGGISNVCFSKAINDYIPASVVQSYSILINAGICFGLFISNLFGLLVPIEDANDPDTYDKLKNDEYWRVVYGSCIVIQLISLLLIFVFVKEISLLNLLQDSTKMDKAIHEIKKIYKFSADTCTAEELADSLKN